MKGVAAERCTIIRKEISMRHERVSGILANAEMTLACRGPTQLINREISGTEMRDLTAGKQIGLCL